MLFNFSPLSQSCTLKSFFLHTSLCMLWLRALVSLIPFQYGRENKFSLSSVHFRIPGLFTLSSMHKWLNFAHVCASMATRTCADPGRMQVASWLYSIAVSLALSAFKQQSGSQRLLNCSTKSTESSALCRDVSFSPYTHLLQLKWSAALWSLALFRNFKMRAAKSLTSACVLNAQRNLSSILKRLVRWLFKIWGNSRYFCASTYKKFHQENFLCMPYFSYEVRKCQKGREIAFYNSISSRN
jgi:hypothetical protein